MKSVEAQGYSKDKALEQTGLDIELERLKNATLAWKKAGSPMSTKQLNAFMAAYIKEKKAVGAYIVVEPASDDTRLRPYTVINEVTKGKRKSTTTYQIKEAELTVKYHTETKIVETTDAEGVVTSKEVEFQTPYIKETVQVETKVIDSETGIESIVTSTKEVDVPQVKVLALGAVEAKATKKDEAFRIMKDLIEVNKKDYVVEIVKEITEGQKYAGYGQYTPSKSAKMGKFVFFVQE